MAWIVKANKAAPEKIPTPSQLRYKKTEAKTAKVAKATADAVR
jgi:hypothetical protein